MSELIADLNTQPGDELLAELTEEFLRRHRAGEQPSVEDYVGMHPGLADRIRELFLAVVMMEQPAADATVDLTPAAERVGATIGRYKLLERIGEGGFGVVYMAEQQHPLRRKVALKVVKPGFDTRQVIARFEAERQALALMDHENIAKVFDAGATDSGHPYFVMELVHGVPITEFCDKNEFSPRERLDLFIKVCRAVQHAHTKGVIHRDIKPTNVLVTLHEGVPVPKVIDFGIAKATGQQLTEKTLFTNFAQLLGTPLYMSPEQAEMTSLDVDTRSDIYSLGVLLYELLTGTTPLDKERLKQAAFDEVRRIIREEEPPRPSTRLSTMGKQRRSISASDRNRDPKQLSQIIRGELDWIVMKALEKERARRYETASGLARDIERYLRDETVEACPPSGAYRLRKFVRRNRVAVMAVLGGFATLLVLLTGLIISNRMIGASRNETVQALRQKEAALSEAESQRQRAEASFLKAREAVRDLLTSPALGSNEWNQLPMSLRKKFEEKAAKYYANLLQGTSPDPSLRYESAVGLRSLGDLYQESDPERAEEHLRQSIVLLEELHREAPCRTEYRKELGWSHAILFSILLESGRDSEAETAERRALQLYGTTPNEQREAAEWYLSRARQKIHVGRMREAADLYDRSLRVVSDDHVAWYHAATLHLSLGNMDRYRRACRELLDRFKQRAEQDLVIAERAAKTCALAPDSVDDFSSVERLAELAIPGAETDVYRKFVLIVSGLVEYRAGRSQQAIHWIQRATPDVDGDYLDATAFATLAMAQHQLGQTDNALESLDAALVTIDRKPRDAMRGGNWHDWLHGEILAREAQAVLKVSPQELTTIRQQKLDRKLAELSQDVERDPKESKNYMARAIFHFQAGHFHEAVADLDKAMALDPGNPYHSYPAAAVYLYLGEADRYRRTCSEMLDRVEKIPPGNPQIADWVSKTCSLAAAAVPDFTRVQNVSQKAVTGTEDHAYYRLFALSKGLADYRSGQDQQSIYWLERFAPRAAGTHWDATAFAVLAMTNHRLGQADQARSALDYSQEIFANKPPNATRSIPWLDWLHSEIMIREAKKILEH